MNCDKNVKRLDCPLADSPREGGRGRACPLHHPGKGAGCRRHSPPGPFPIYIQGQPWSPEQRGPCETASGPGGLGPRARPGWGAGSPYGKRPETGQPPGALLLGRLCTGLRPAGSPGAGRGPPVRAAASQEPRDALRIDFPLGGGTIKPVVSASIRVVMKREDSGLCAA